MLSLRLFSVPNQTISYASVLDSIHHAQIRSCPVDITHCVTVQRWESHLLTGMIAPHTPTGSCLVKHKKLSSGEKQKSLTEISLVHNLTQNHTKTSICLVINIFIMGVNMLPWIYFFFLQRHSKLCEELKQEFKLRFWFTTLFVAWLSLFLPVFLSRVRYPARGDILPHLLLPGLLL